MSKIIGIDLGTTNSCVAVIEHDEAVILPNAEGDRVTPSVVAVTDAGERLIGALAKRQGITNARNTVSAVKRFIGRTFDSEAVERAREVAPFDVRSADNGDIRIVIQDLELSPEEISAWILMKMRATAEEYLGEEITEAVITVPAYYDDRQRQATKDAGTIAGLDVLRIINEPTAAALAYGIHKRSRETIAVYDLGGGTFDVSILELSEGVFEVKATRGDTFLGGEDFDRRVIDWMMGRFADDTGIDLHGDPVVMQRLKEAAERAKIELSTALETTINLPFIAADETGPKHLEATLSRAELENLVEDLVERTLEPCRACLEDARLGVDDIDTLILVGGQTRTPLVQERVKEFFERIPLHGINPDEVVAAGAAIQGGVLAGHVEDTVLLDVIPLALGVETFGGVMTKIVERNTSIPTRVSRLFSTAEDNQDMVRVHVLQGEREMAQDNRSLGLFELHGIPPQPRGVPQIEVIFDIDHNGILNVTAMDRATGRAQEIRIANAGGLSQGEIERMVQDAEDYRETDLEHRERARIQNAISNLVYQCQRTLEDRRAELEREKVRALEDAVRKLEAARDDMNVTIDELIERRDEALEVIRDAVG